MSETRALAGRYESRATRAIRAIKSFLAPPQAVNWSHQNTTLIADVSKFIPKTDVHELVQNGVRGLIARIGEGFDKDNDPTWPIFVQAAYDNDIPCFGYFPNHPEVGDTATGNWMPQRDFILKHCEDKVIKGVWIDIEVANGATSTWVSERSRSLIDEVKRQRPDLIVGPYSANWFIKTYSPQILNWIINYPYWWAYYPYAKGTVTCSWAELWASHMPAMNIPPDTPCKGTTAVTPALWQFAGDVFKLPGFYGATGLPSAGDLNLFWGDAEAWYKWCGYDSRGITEPIPGTTPTPKPDPEPEPKPDPEPTPTDGTVLAELQKMNANIIELTKRVDAAMPVGATWTRTK